jgi:hypothetical protein
LQVERGLRAARDLNLARGARREAFGLRLDKVSARREPLEAVSALRVGRRGEA